MKFSVIIPIYNVKNYLSECVESIIQQTYSNFELILVDDGSTDGSAIICDEYSKKYPDFVKTLHVQNGGPLRARLIGINAAEGDVLIFVDADDCLRKDALKVLVEGFCKYNCDMILYNSELCDDFPSIEVTYSFDDGQIFEGETKHLLYENFINGRVSNGLCFKALRSKCASFPLHLMDYTMRYGEDLLLSAYFLTNCDKVVYRNEGLYHYRNRPGSAIHSFNINKRESVKAVHTELEKIVELWNVPKLKQLHSSRKVKGWIENLISLLKNRKRMDKSEFRRQIGIMSKDSYFRHAYVDMDKSQLSYSRRFLAFLLYHCRFLFK